MSSILERKSGLNGVAASPTDSPSLSSSEESDRAHTFIGTTGPVIGSSRQPQVNRSGRMTSRLPLGSQPLQPTQPSTVGGPLPASLNQPLLVAWPLSSTTTDTAEPGSTAFLPLSVYFTRCLVCGQDMASGNTSGPRQLAPCVGPDSASQLSLQSGSEAEALPAYALDWRRRHCYGYWQSVCERRSRETQLDACSEPKQVEDRDQVSREILATEAPVPRVVKAFDCIHPARYDYAFLIFTLLLFPYTWSLILLLYTTGWFLFESFFWECCGTFMPRSRGCEQIVALDSDHVVCIRIYDSRRLIPRSIDQAP
jgi:hypothetical protein